MTESNPNANAEMQRFYARMASLPSGKPIVMLNLLNFRDQAKYPEQHPNHASGSSGRAAYEVYKELLVPYMAEHVGAKLLFRGDVAASLIGPEDEAWDEVILVEYPSLEKFASMVQDPEYHKIAIHRSAALKDSRLVALTSS